jgi:sulfite reductase (NADPH) flavoprotein alpha-component
VTARVAVSSRSVLDAAAETNRRLGHENLGFLSESHGTMPVSPPRLRMSASHREWDELAEQLPWLFKTMGVRRAFDEMAVLEAGPDELPDEELLRASTLLSMFAHSYHRVDLAAPERLPPSIERPWRQVSDRLDRRAPHLSYIDLIVHNWRLRNPERADPMRIENLELLVPSVDNQEERTFYLVQVEILAQSSGAVGACVRAQEAAARDDPETLERELILIAETLQRVARESFTKIRPDPYAASYVDNVVWAKTVAPFAVPISAGVAGPSGTSAPLFHVLDQFFGRRHFDSRFGGEMQHLREWFPVHWRDFLTALGEFNVLDYVAHRGDRALEGIFKEAIQAYMGDHGFLKRHRLKVHGYLDIAFKVGRDVTITGFTGKFADRTWEQVDGELAAATVERRGDAPTPVRRGRIAAVEDANVEAEGWVKHVILDVSGTGVRYQPGDRVSVLPENRPDLVERTLAALRARSDEPVQLTHAWRDAIGAREELAGATELPMRTLLSLGRIRPVQREVAKALLAASGDATLREIVRARAEDQWELWDLLELLARGGFDPRTLWRAHPGERQHICRIVPPEQPRMYSISSALEGDERGAGELHLTIGGLHYSSADAPPVSVPLERRGTASTYLGDPDPWGGEPGASLPFTIVRPPRFALPDDGEAPVVMFAGGTGIAPFRGFIQERARRRDPGESWLFLATRTEADVYYRRELEEAAAAGRLKLRIAISDAPVAARLVADDDGARLVFEPGKPRRIDAEMLAEETARELWDLLRPAGEGGRGGRFYVCGRTGFARTIIDALKEVARRVGGVDDAELDRLLGRLAAEQRLMLDVFTTYPGPHPLEPARFDASDIVLHNDDREGWWLVVDGRVYDVGEFMHLHPGGEKIVRAYGGMDATRPYRAVLHHVDSEVDALRGIYEIGVVRRLDFGTEWGVAIGPDGLRYVALADLYRTWMGFLYSVVEMQNALELDFGIRDRPLTRVDGPGEMTVLRLRLLLEAHERFRASYLAFSTGDALHEVWALSSGLCSSSEPVQAIREAVAGIEQSEDARTVAAATAHGAHALREAVEAGTVGEADLAALAAWAQTLETEDKRYMAELKSILREGIVLFETHERATVREAREALLGCVRAVPSLLAAYYARLAPAAVEQQPAAAARFAS